MYSGGPGALTLARQPGRNAEARQLDLVGRNIHDDIRWLDILVDESALVQLAKRCRQGDGKPQESSDVHRPPDEAAEPLAPGRFQQQDRLPMLMHQVQRPHRPRRVEMVLRSIFVCEFTDAAGGRLLTGASYRHELLLATLGAFAPSSAEDTFSVLPQHLESAVLAMTGSREWVHLWSSAARPVSECVPTEADQANLVVKIKRLSPSAGLRFQQTSRISWDRSVRFDPLVARVVESGVFF